MEHTYLRYECADAFALTTASASSRAPQSNSILAFLGDSSPKDPIVSTAGSQCCGFSLKQNRLALKIGHRERLSGGVGTGRALNSDEVVCVAISPSSSGDNKVATGWLDGAIRVFDVAGSNIANEAGLVHSLVHEEEDDDFVMQEPLLLQGHANTPVRSICFDQGGTRLASGASDGSVVLWDIVAETGLFRLLGHRGGITEIVFCRVGTFDGLITTSLDGLVKVWDLDGQCCTQTIANHRGEVLGAASARVGTSDDNEDEQDRVRLITGSTDGQVRVWSVQQPNRNATSNKDQDETSMSDVPTAGNDDDVCHYMGSLIPPPNVSTSAEKVQTIHYHPNGRYVGILHSGSKTVDVYLIRSMQESLRKKQRRLRRRREKKGKTEERPTGGKKRGILDDVESSDEEAEQDTANDVALDPETLKASDEFEYYGTVRASHKIRGFIFVPYKERGGGIRVVCALSTNALETLALVKKKSADGKSVVVSEKVSMLDMYGHPTGIRSIALSSDDTLACTVSKNVTKIWNVDSRSCIHSLSPSPPSMNKKGATGCYGLCATFLPGNTHVVLGTREGHLLIVDIASGDVVYTEENAHDGAIWSLDLRWPTPQQETIAIVTGSADKTLKFWDVEAQDEDEGGAGHPMVVHTRTLQMTDDVVAVRYSHSKDPSKRMVFASTLDSTIKVFFDDTLKFFLSLYGHKLPALAVDSSDDDLILASSGADKTIKIWGLDFGDCHRSLHGHEDSVTDLRFVKGTHNFFTSSKDGTVRYWDGDRFEQILLLNGHCAEVNCLAVSRTGAFILSGGMDRQVRVWERTRDMVFLEEERERELEQVFDKVQGDDRGTASIMRRKDDADLDGDEDQEADADQPQSEAAVKRSALSVSASDRIMEGLERADQELKEAAAFRKSEGGQGKTRMLNPLLLGLEPAQYILWVLRSIKSAELEQSLLVLPLTHVERLIYYLIVLLRSGRGVELCSRVAIFMIKTHQSQVRDCSVVPMNSFCFDDPLYLSDKQC